MRAALLLLALGGCVGGPCHANWMAPLEPERGRFDALAEGARAAGVELRHEPLPRSLPFESAALRERWGHAALYSVTWRADATRAATLFSDGLLGVQASPGAHEAEVRALAGAFLANVSAAGDADRAAWADAIAASPNHETTISPPYRVNDVFRDAYADGWDEAGAFGRADLQAHGWSFSFVLPQRSVELAVEEERVRVSLDAVGRGGLYVTTDARALDAQAAARVANVALGRLALADRLAAADMAEDACGV
ncbi:MAG TPA: hypothetical protein VFH78_00360 [Candidatus Thermoplasmatota archaeon]|nr:hypothetical protein [Candidatus Thermoplasmatota archaeon]